MWDELPPEEKETYKHLILGFACLSPMFSQKAINEVSRSGDAGGLTPIMNSKFQETAFAYAFHGFIEDLGNTSFDASLQKEKPDGSSVKYLVGIKTFGFSSGDQKVAQFKKSSPQLDEFWKAIRAATPEDCPDYEAVRRKAYLAIAKKVSEWRNMRIRSSKANLKGFQIEKGEEPVCVYHVLMPAVEEGVPSIKVGETSYDEIDIEGIREEGIDPTVSGNQGNFIFHDGRHKYKYTRADSQLYMEFSQKEIVKDDWKVKYIGRPFSLVENLYESVYGTMPLAALLGGAPAPAPKKPVASFSWLLKIERFSGLNSFFGIGLLKKSKAGRDASIKKFQEDFSRLPVFAKDPGKLEEIVRNIRECAAAKDEERVEIRARILSASADVPDEKFRESLKGMLFRPVNEVYLPIPWAAAFHNEHPDFFGPGFGTFLANGKTLALPKEQRIFDLVFLPSETKIPSFVTQDFGKGIQSVNEQAALGRWILREVFQLKEYEPLTDERLEEIGINGIRLFKYEKKGPVYLEFIQIDPENLPSDFWGPDPKKA